MTPARALLLVPPLVKYTAGPMLGPAVLAGAAEEAGHAVRVLDVNARYLRRVLPSAAWGWHSSFVGDHDKPADALARVEAAFLERVARDVGCDVEAVRTMSLSFEAIESASRSVASSADGSWLRAELAEWRRPDVVGVSVMFAGQVIWALAATMLARTVWPGVPVVWGGTHVTALREAIAADPQYGHHINGFVFGHAAQTFVDILDSVGRGALPEAVARAGAGRMPTALDREGAVPRFDELELYDAFHLSLPVQTSRGCAYGKCRFCTYPAIDGAYGLTSLAVLDAVVEQAATLGAAVSIKDSLVIPRRLREIALRVGGRVRWSACTKLHAALDEALLHTLKASGCETLEVGLETLDPAVQHLIDKVQSRANLLQLLDAAAVTSIALVINTMSGFPGEEPATLARWTGWLATEIERRPRLSARVEHNRFQLERLAPMAHDPRGSGIRVVGSWPWSSVLEHETLERRRVLLGVAT